MTGLEVVTLLATASMIGHAVAGNGPWQTIAVLCLFGALLVSVQWFSLKFNWVERVMTGRATTIIQDGQIIEKHLIKLRMTVDQVEAKLREKGIVSLADVKTATLEINGELGYELMPEAKPVTARDFERILAAVSWQAPPAETAGPADNLFDEVRSGGHKQDMPPPHLN